jgi:superfamily II DNA or RNA helicase
MPNAASRQQRARKILRSHDRTDFPFQAAAAARCLESIDRRGRLLVEAPTGSGKTLISHLVAGLLAGELRDRFPRVLVVVPSRSLLHQHVEDAAWLGPAFDLAVHRLDPDVPMSLFDGVMRSPGVVHTTPITLTNRLSAWPAGPRLLAGFDVAIFDEVDTYLTVDELLERRDTWPALQMCRDAGLPVIGFTGTHLTRRQEDTWRRYGFAKFEAEVPEDWMPYTPVHFVPVHDDEVSYEDAEIREELRQAFRALTMERRYAVTWGDVKRLGRWGHPGALKILGLCGDRLRLFESPRYLDAKLAAISAETAKPGPALLLARFRDTAQTLEWSADATGVTVFRADGSMKRSDIGYAMNQFRAMSADAQGVLVITRELGGRGLDFPSAARIVVASPRSSYQAVAQELARIRSRKSMPKSAVITYFADTEEQAKALRLARHLASERFRKSALFEVTEMPGDTYRLEPLESRILAYEESLGGV